MFRLHETARRRVVRTALVLLCAVPAAVVAAWILYAARPWRLADEQARLESLLHASVTLSNWRTPRPGVVQTRRLALARPRDAAPAAELQEVTIDDRGEALAVHAESASLDARRLDAFAAGLSQWAAATDCRTLDLRISRLELHRGEPEGVVEFRSIAARLELAPNGSITGRLEAHAIGDEQEKSLDVQWHRSARGAEPSDRVVIDCRQIPLPGWLVAVMAPPLDVGGGNAKFAGLLQADVQRERAEGIAQGRFTQFDLAALLPAGSPHRVQGLAEAALGELRWADRQVRRAAGAIRAADIRASRSLLEAASRFLLCPSATTADDVVVVDALALTFQLDQRGLTIAGDFAPDAGLPAGCMAAAGGRAVLMEPPYAELPAGAWVQVVAAPGASWVPATLEAIEFAQRLPLPESASGGAR